MVRNIINTFFTRVFASLANLLIAIIISNVYGASVKGEQGLILTSITLITLLTAVVGAGSLVYLTPRYETRHLLVPAYVWNVLICCTIYVTFVTFEILPEEFVLHTVLLTFMLSLSQIHSGLLIGREKIRQSNFAFLLNNVLVFCSLLFFVFVWKMPSVYAYVNALYIGYLVHLLVSTYLVLHDPAKPVSQPAGNSNFMSGFLALLRFGLLNQLDVIAQMLSFRLSYYFIHHFISKSAVGVYSNAISIIESIWLISRSISMVQNARIANSNDPDYSLRITVNLLKVSFCLVFVALLVLIAIPARFYEFLFGNEFGEMRIVILSISPGVLLFSTSFILSGLYAGTGKYIYNTWASVAGLAVTIVLAMLLIPAYGLIGAGITASVSYMVSVGIKLAVLFSRYRVRFSDFRITRSDIRFFRDLISASRS